jgi:hypothetical protein
MRSGKIAGEATQADLEEISRRWKVESLAGIEEAWWDDRLWLLNALGGICDLRCFYHHLRSE